MLSTVITKGKIIPQVAGRNLVVMGKHMALIEMLVSWI